MGGSSGGFFESSKATVRPNPLPVTVDTSSGAVLVADFGLEVALGNVSGYSKVNKFGQALDCDSGVATDVWDGADGSTSTDVWVAPTAAAVHNLVSTDNDDGAGSSTGMLTCRVYGLTDWDTAETSEDVTLTGTTPVATSSSYVIIHRITGLTFGSTGSNEGIITATATAPSATTITAAIQAGEGQTLMCIYGVPSTQTIHIVGRETGVLGNASTDSDGTLLVKLNADLSTSGFVTKDRWKFTDTSPLERAYVVPKSFSGPCVVKIQAETDTPNASCTASFDAYVVDN